jgi:hypothetical protein
MTVESAAYLNDFNVALPPGSDPKNEGDNHLTLIKAVLQATLPGLAGRVWRTQQKTSNYNLATTDNMTLVEVTATGVTVGTAAAIGTLGNGFVVIIFANGFDVTFDPNGSETINDGSTTSRLITNGDSALVIAGASRWSLIPLSRFAFPDNLFRVFDDGDNTKRIALDVGGVTTGTTRTLTAQDANGTLALVSEFAYTNLIGTTGRLVLPQGYLSGLTIANNGVDPDADVDVAVGSARDATNAHNMLLDTALVKRLDVPWAVGTGGGGLDTGSKTANTWYYPWLIKRSDTGVVDVLFSASATSPTMPASYDFKRRLPGAVFTDGSANIIPVVQTGRRFDWKTPVQDVSASGSTTAVAHTLTVPPIAGIRAVGSHNLSGSGTTTHRLRLFATDDVDAAVTAANMTLTCESVAGTTFGVSAAHFDVRVDASGQVKMRANTTGSTYRILTSGWTDHTV